MARIVCEEKWVETRWGKLYLRALGTGEPLFLVHGLGVSGSYFLRAAEQLSTHFRVFVPDLPGSGRSAKPKHVLKIPELADVLVELAHLLGLEKAHWIGNSFGCQILAELAVKQPQLLHSLILLGPTIDSAHRSTIQQGVRLVIDATREPFSEVLIALQDYARFGPRRFLLTFFDALNDRIEHKLPNILTPTLVVRGGRDPIVPQRWAQQLAALLPNGRLVVVPKAAHTVNYKAAAEFARIVRAFIRETTPPADPSPLQTQAEPAPAASPGNSPSHTAPI